MMISSVDPAELPGRSPERDQIGDEAAKWFARLADDSASEADFAAYRAWRDASPVHAEAYDRTAAAYAAVGEHAEIPEILDMRMAALAAQPARYNPRRYPFSLTAVAASIALIISAALLVVLNGAAFLDAPARDDRPTLSQRGPASGPPTLKQADSMAAEKVAAPKDFRTDYTTRIGQIAQFTLPDGSMIELNTGSEVEVNYTAARRDLTLVRGEAVFTVAKDAERPFIVKAGESRVVALGTIFSVRKSNGEAQVTLIEGRVRVDQAAQSGSDKSTQLAPGEQISILPNRPFEITRAELSQVASWREGRLVFEQTPLRDVLKEFNRYSAEKHVLRDEALGDFLVSGTFRIKSSEYFAATLEAGFPVVVRARAGGSILEVTSAQDSGSFEPQFNN